MDIAHRPMKVKRFLAFVFIMGWLIGSGLAEAQTQLTLVKELAGGEAKVTDWVLTADGADANNLSGAGFMSGFVSPDAPVDADGCPL